MKNRVRTTQKWKHKRKQNKGLFVTGTLTNKVLSSFGENNTNQKLGTLNRKALSRVKPSDSYSTKNFSLKAWLSGEKLRLNGRLVKMRQ